MKPTTSFDIWFKQLVGVAERYDWDKDMLGDQDSFMDAYEDGVTPDEAFREIVELGEG